MQLKFQKRRNRLTYKNISFQLSIIKIVNLTKLGFSNRLAIY